MADSPQDSLQAFASSIAGLLASRAVLEGVGVGDATASPTAALLLTVVQESMGRIATILFAHKLGTSLEPECKMWRLAADVFNDAAMVLDCFSPVLPKGPRVLLLSISSALRALCGVAAGSAKASLSAHFARWGNLGELNAKDSSQETMISLMGMLAGSVVVSYVSSSSTTWACLVVLLSIHLAMNHAAVRAVSMRTLNRQRASLVFSYMFENGKVLGPGQASARERIFDYDGALRWNGGPVIGRAKIGIPLLSLVKSLGPRHRTTGSISDTTISLDQLFEMFRSEEYILWYDEPHHDAFIVLKSGATPNSQLKAWAHALWLCHRITESKKTFQDKEMTLELLASTREDVCKTWDDNVALLRAAGWDLETASLETTSAVRVTLDAAAPAVQN